MSNSADNLITRIAVVSFYSPTCSTGIEKTMRNILPTLANYHKITVTYFSNSKITEKEQQWFTGFDIRYKHFVLPKLLGLEFYLYIILSNIWLLTSKNSWRIVVGNNISIFPYLLISGKKRANITTVTIFQNVKEAYYSTCKETYALWKKILICTDRYVALHSDKIIAVSRGVSRQLQDFYGIEENRIDMIYNSVEFPVQEVYGIPTDYSVKKLLFISNDNKRKGIDVFMSLVNLYKDRVDVKFTIVGTDRYGIAEQPNLELLGYVPNEQLKKVLQGTFLLVLPSRNEGHPFVALEALSYGVPVICSRLANVEIIESSKAGFIVDSFAPADYKNKVDIYLNDYKYYQEGREDARRLIRDVFSLEKVRTMYLDYFNRIIYNEHR